MTEPRHIVLKGGPSDGQRQWWEGGDVLRVSIIPPVRFPTWRTVEMPAVDAPGEYRETGRFEGGYSIFEWTPR